MARAEGRLGVGEAFPQPNTGGKVKREIECLDCGHKLTTIQAADEPPPAFCPFCGNGEPPTRRDFTVVPYIGSLRSRTIDKTYRDLEESSQVRHELVRERRDSELDAAARDAPHLREAIEQVKRHGPEGVKITDMRDDVREGEIAVKMTANNAVTQYADALAQASGEPGFNYFQGGGGGQVAELVQAASTGPGAKSGFVAGTLGGITGDHSKMAASVVKQLPPDKWKGR